MNLPPLPDKVQVDKHLPTGVVIWGYTKESMRAYGAACADAALEEAAKACGLESVTLATRDQTRGALHCAAAIRALKENT